MSTGLSGDFENTPDDKPMTATESLKIQEKVARQAAEALVERGQDRMRRVVATMKENERLCVEAFDSLHVNPWESWIRTRWDRQSLAHARTFKETLAIIGLGLGGEAGEAQEHVKKFIRDGKPMGEELLLELGDVLHYVTRLAQLNGWSLAELMRANALKLQLRDERDAELDKKFGFE